jgi:hypothetical protein
VADYGRLVSCRVAIDPRIFIEERRRDDRKRRYARRMMLAGIRPASIPRYLARGFRGAFARAIETEMSHFNWAFKRWPRRVRRRGDPASLSAGHGSEE